VSEGVRLSEKERGREREREREREERGRERLCVYEGTKYERGARANEKNQARRGVSERERERERER
jgi:hypothetical protein